MVIKAKNKNKTDAAKELAKAKSALRRELSLDETGERKISPLAEKKKKLRKKRFRQGILAIIAGFFVYVGYWLFKPYEFGMEYGVCKTFIELNVPYPTTIYYSEIIPFGNSIRIWYSYSDTFGKFRLEPVQCFFGAHEQFGMGVTRITVGRREVDPEIVARFNNSLSAIFAYPPELVWPAPLPNDPANLQFDFERYRKSIL